MVIDVSVKERFTETSSPLKENVLTPSVNMEVSISSLKTRVNDVFTGTFSAPFDGLADITVGGKVRMVVKLRA